MTVEQALKMFKAFSDRTRLRIFLLLLQSELCVCQMTEILKVEQSLLSHQLRCLKKAGLVQARKRGRWVFYYVTEDYRQLLSPVFEDWFKEEMKNFQPKIARAEQRVVCPLPNSSAGLKKSKKAGRSTNREKKKKS